MEGLTITAESDAAIGLDELAGAELILPWMPLLARAGISLTAVAVALLTFWPCNVN